LDERQALSHDEVAGGHGPAVATGRETPCRPLRGEPDMSVVDRSEQESGVEFDQLPEFELECMYDDWDDPTAVTVFSTEESDSLYTAWLTADRDHAVSLDAVR
jgi:hypothetical protein